MAVRAPFAFAPINRWVYFPEWRDCISHDVPFEDGLSGSIAIVIETKTPLLVGGPRRKATAQTKGVPASKGDVWPFKLPGPAGAYAIPPAALQGMVRSILEIAAFGKLAPWIDERRFGYRDLSPGATADEYYKARLANFEPGWLINTSKGLKIARCRAARIVFAEISTFGTGANQNLAQTLIDGTSADKRYRSFLGNQTLDKLDGRFRVDAQNNAVWSPQQGPLRGTLVLTGKPQPGVGHGHKRKEFVFHTPDRKSAASSATMLDVDLGVWSDFELIHEAQPGREINPNWSFWKKEFQQGHPIPIFFVEEAGKVAAITTAFMGKAAMPLSTLQMLDHSSPRHKDAALDLPSAIFGAIAEASVGLKRRAAFDLAVGPGADVPLHELEGAILLSPKPSYFPIYVRQPGKAGILDDPDKPYALYAKSTIHNEPEREDPELAGVKIWPARDQVSTNGHPSELACTLSVQADLHAVPTNQSFKTRLRFHNLKPQELGAVLWALSFGDPAAWTDASDISRRHRLGMGKPYGLGEIAIRLGDLDLAWGDMTAEDLVKAFTKHMAIVYAASRDPSDWANSVQVCALDRASRPDRNGVLPADPYMPLGRGKEPPADTYRGEREAHRFLPPYETGGEAPRPELPIGAQVRLGNGSHGVIAEPGKHVAPNQPEQWWVLLDGEKKTRLFRRTMFTVIAPALGL